MGCRPITCSPLTERRLLSTDPIVGTTACSSSMVSFSVDEKLALS